MNPLRSGGKVAPLHWFRCTRCDRCFYTETIRGDCDPCRAAAAEFWPGVIEPYLAVSGC